MGVFLRCRGASLEDHHASRDGLVQVGVCAKETMSVAPPLLEVSMVVVAGQVIAIGADRASARSLDQLQ